MHNRLYSPHCTVAQTMKGRSSGVGGMMRMVLLSLAACAYGLPSGKPNALLAKSDGHTSWEDSAPGGGGMTAFTL